ncbi:MAG: alpha/beta fold hydrolase [Pirellulaceae bacterium]
MAWCELPKFVPHSWLRSAHAQTIAGAYWRLPPFQLATRPHRVCLGDGDRVVVHEDQPTRELDSGRTALLIHGLGGCHRSKYVHRLAARLLERGWRVLRMDMRGFGAGSLEARQHTHAGRWQDIAAVIEAMVAPLSRLSVIGFSMGANQLLKLLGCWEGARPERIEKAIAVAPPLKLWLCAATLDRGLNRIYDWSFVRTLKRQVQRRRDVPGFVSTSELPLPDRLRKFDAQWTAPLGGFRDVDDYYEQASAVHDLGLIRVPTMILAAEDDPLVPISTFHDLPISSRVRVATTTHGGHLGYIGQTGLDPDRFWLDWRLIEQLESPLAMA